MPITFDNIQVTGGMQFLGENQPIPQTADPYWANVNLLLNTASSNNQTNGVFLDSSTNNFTITTNGTPIQGSLSPFTKSSNSSYNPSTDGASALFSGGSDYLSISDNAALELGSDDFTIEGWIYINSYVGTSGILTKGNPYSPFLIYIGGSNELAFYASTNGSTWAVGDLRFANSPALNTWHHIAVTRSGNTVRTFFNGALANSATLTGSLVNNANSLFIGRYTASFNGRLSNIRIVKGTALYTGNFTVPISPLTAISGTSLLLNFTNAGVYDAAQKNFVTLTNNTSVSTAQYVWAPSSVVFDGTDDIASVPATSILSLTGDFTLECWVYRSAGTAATLIGQNIGFVGGAFQQRYQFGINGSNNLEFIYWTNSNGASSVTRTTTGTVPTTTWTHVAASKTGTTLKLFINGVQSYSGTEQAIFYGAAMATGIGGTYSLLQPELNGYMEDVRITKGVGRYTANFTPPTGPFASF